MTLCVRSAQDWALPHPERHHGARALCLGLPHARTRVLVQGSPRALRPPQAADAARCWGAASRCLPDAASAGAQRVTRAPLEPAVAARPRGACCGSSLAPDFTARLDTRFGSPVLRPGAPGTWNLAVTSDSSRPSAPVGPSVARPPAGSRVALVSWPPLQTYLPETGGDLPDSVGRAHCGSLSSETRASKKKNLQEKGKNGKCLFFPVLLFSKTCYTRPPFPTPTSPALSMPLQAAPCSHP